MTHKQISSFRNNRGNHDNRDHTDKIPCPCFNGLNLKHHPDNRPNTEDLPVTKAEIQTVWHNTKNTLWHLVRKKGIPRIIAPQQGYLIHTVNGISNKIDVCDIPYLHLQTDSQQDIAIPVIRQGEFGEMPALLVTSRPECNRLLESYRLYLINYSAMINKFYTQLMMERFTLKMNITRSELNDILLGVRDKLWKRMIRITPDQVKSTEWLKLW